MGCSDRYEPEEFTPAEIERQKREREREDALALNRKTAEEIWVRFARKGPAGITVDELNAQSERLRELYKLQERQKVLEKQLRENQERQHLLRSQCIHLTTKGESAFERGMYDICNICADMR